MSDTEPSAITPEQLSDAIESLAGWGEAESIGAAEWKRYIEVALLVQGAPLEVVEQALTAFISEAEAEGRDFLRDRDYEEESKPFLLMRIVFDLPEEAPRSSLRSFKGWVNWDDAFNTDGTVNLSWPVDWNEGVPRLLSNCEGSHGVPYAAASEYRHFLEQYKFRELK